MANAAYAKAKPRRGNNTPDLEEVGLGMGRIPPQALDFERSVLASLLLDPECVEDVMAAIPDNRAFYDPRHQIIYSAIRELFNAHIPVDLQTVRQKLAITKLRKLEDGKDLEVVALDEIGGDDFLGAITDNLIASARLEYYCGVVQQKFIQRELIAASIKILGSAYDDTVDMQDLIELAQSEVFNAVDKNTSKDAVRIDQVAREVLDDLEKMQNRTELYTGIPSGFSSLDEITSGFQPSDLIILAARPSVGKTALALNFARNAAVDHKIPVAIFSLEMPTKQLGRRLILSESHFDGKKFKGGVKMEPGEWSQLESSIENLTSSALYIDDTPSLPVMEFRSKVKKLVKQKGVGLVVVDYLQLMQGPPELRGFREQEVAAISRTLKATAKEMNIPIIALSQLSRRSEQREKSNNKPQLSDLRESGSIEQDADMVLFIHRYDYQGMGGDDVAEGDTELIIAKHRNGEIGNIKLLFRASEARFVDARDVPFLDSVDQAPKVEEFPSAMNSMTVDESMDFTPGSDVGF